MLVRPYSLACIFCIAILAGRVASAASLSDFVDFTMPNPGISSPLLPGRLYVPPDAANGPRPLILFLHGAGESGNIDNLLFEAKRRGAYLYAPPNE